MIIIAVHYTVHNGAVPLPAPPSVSRMSYVRLNPVPLYRSPVHHLCYHPYGFFTIFFFFCFTNHVQFIVIADRPSVSRKHPVFFSPRRLHASFTDIIEKVCIAIFVHATISFAYVRKSRQDVIFETCFYVYCSSKKSTTIVSCSYNKHEQIHVLIAFMQYTIFNTT